MSEKEKFTKGNWHVYMSKRSEHKEYASILDSDGKEVCLTVDRKNRCERKANAHLISVAPKMYRAIKYILDSGSISDALYNSVLEKLLAEARGEVIK